MKKKTLTMGSKMAIATASAETSGFKSFKKGSPGAAQREKVATGLSKSYTIKPGKAKSK